MTPDRWEQINKLYYAALEVTEQQRASFLEAACGADAELRGEVESLLNTHEQVDGFLGKPAMEEVAKVMQDEPPSLVGKQLGPYQVLGVIGAGGMGEVYKGRDTRLNRTVAIKVLPRHLSERADLRQRFEREARAIASLDHPHICALYDIGREQDIDFLVMQYLEGETLSQRLKRGPLPTEEVFRCAIEIVGGLGQAHGKGVIHRDLKPGNIMLTQTGAKLLDFGLAKLTGGTRAPSRVLPSVRGSARSTLESLTEEGMLLGTLEYMAPEQLEGKDADPRTDIFTLGVVIYEMATGRKAFEGDSRASIMAKILTAQPPPMATIEPVTPPELDRVVQKCLAKKPEERWLSAAEVTSELQEIAETALPRPKVRKRQTEEKGEGKDIQSKAGPAEQAIPEPPNVLARLIRSRSWRLSFVGLLLAAITGSLALWRGRQQPEKAKGISFKPLTSYSWDNPLDSAAISPDGKYLAYCSKRNLFVQVILTGEKRSLVIPEGFHPTQVGWFPDGTKLLLSRFEGRWTQVKGQASLQFDNSLWSMSILGGAPQKIADHLTGWSVPTVSPDGSLVAFDGVDTERQTTDIWLVRANGEGPRKLRQSLSQPDRVFYAGPVWSTNGQRLFYRRNDDKNEAIESCDLGGENVSRIFSTKGEAGGFSSLCSAPDGRILFSLAEEGPPPTIFNLWEIKVDATTGRPLSEARRFTQWSGFSFEDSDHLSITANGKQLALLRRNAQADVYVAQLEPGGKAMKNPRRLTLEESNDAVHDWTADSRAVLFESNRNGNPDIFRQDISQTDAEVIVATSEYEWHPKLSPDRAFILYLVSEKPSPDATRLMRIPVGGGPPELVLRGEKIKNFSCAREAKLCVVAEDVEGKQIFTAFDPLKGRGEKLLQPDHPDSDMCMLSPQGRLVEKMKPGPKGLQVRILSLTGEPVEEITFKDLNEDYNFFGWSVDGKGIYLMGWTPSNYRDYRLFYAGLDGHSQVLWKRGSSPGYTPGQPVPSPDGRHLAFTVVTYEANAWMVENF
jgi:serine/threonine protein kinase